MVMLVAITLIGVFVMSGSHLEWLMSSNSRFQTDAEMRAEAAIQEGENDAATITDPNSYLWSDEKYITPLPYDPRNTANWTKFITKPATTISPAVYLVEYMGCNDQSGGGGCNPCPLDTPCFYIYRIWAHAADSRGASRIVQSTSMIKIIHYSPSGHGTPSPTVTPTRIGFAEIDHDQPPNP